MARLSLRGYYKCRRNIAHLHKGRWRAWLCSYGDDVAVVALPVGLLALAAGLWALTALGGPGGRYFGGWANRLTGSPLGLGLALAAVALWLLAWGLLNVTRR